MRALMVGNRNGKRSLRWAVVLFAFVLLPPLLAAITGYAYARLVGEWQQAPAVFGLGAGFAVALAVLVSGLTAPLDKLKPLAPRAAAASPPAPSPAEPQRSAPDNGQPLEEFDAESLFDAEEEIEIPVDDLIADGQIWPQPSPAAGTAAPAAPPAPIAAPSPVPAADPTSALNDLSARINEILALEEYSDFMLERVYRMERDIVGPVVAALRQRPGHEDAVREVRALHQAVEEYVVCFRAEPQLRETRRKQVEGAKGAVRRRLLADEDDEGEVELLLDEIRKWQWKTGLDARGRLVYATADGKQIPPRAIIAEKVGLKVIARAVKALQPYSEKLRPRDARGEPGGLVVLENAQRLIVAGDLHGRYDNLERILKDKNNLEDILAGQAHLIFTGDAIHPRASVLNDASAYEDSFCTMLLIMTLKAENPFHVHYLLGNHDHSHIGGRTAGRGEVRQDELFEQHSAKRWGREVFEHYRRFVRQSPIAMKAVAPNGAIILVHAGLSARVKSVQDLININLEGPLGPALCDLIWSRKYDDRQLMQRCLDNVGAKLLVVGHTPPTRRRAERYGLEVIHEGVFAHVHHLQVILNAQKNVFGYLNLDLTRPLPDEVTGLLAPDGKSAYRLLAWKKP